MFRGSVVSALTPTDDECERTSGLLVVDLPVAIDVRLADHLVDLLVRQLLAEVRHHVAQLGGADEAVAITVEHLF